MRKRQTTQNGAANADELFRDAEQREDRGDFKGAFERHMAAARLGHVLSQLALGNSYSRGRGVQKNTQEAARWYMKVYRNGLSAGAVNLSVDLQNQGNMRGAIAWLKRAAAMNDGDACVQLARIYLKRRGGTKVAAGLLRKAVSYRSSETSDDAREQAEVLLKSIENA
jgi:TPR repeat protein